jgi:lysozyme family protein
MASFQQADALTSQIKGGYANNKLNRGGETYTGVARNFWPKRAG